jgi:molybdenum cofactor synthesis domain-containing protein
VLAASMLVIGDEILGGFVTDTNSPWLADRLRAHGVPLERIHVIPDDADAIAEALAAELARARPRVIVTSGGIGSTPDDITYEAVAAALGRELVEDEVLAGPMRAIVARTREAGFTTSDAFAWHVLRMARIPAGSRLMAREGGWTPAVCVDVDGGADAADGRGATVVVLPGVPSEFRALLGEAVEPALLAERNAVPHVVELTHGLPESLLNEAFVELGVRFPAVKLGSYPGRPMIVRLTGSHDDAEAAAAFVRSAIDALESDPAAARLPRRWRAAAEDA